MAAEEPVEIASKSRLQEEVNELVVLTPSDSQLAPH